MRGHVGETVYDELVRLSGLSAKFTAKDRKEIARWYKAEYEKMDDGGDFEAAPIIREKIE